MTCRAPLEGIGAIVALGCRVRDGRPSPALARRLALAARAHAAHVSTRILASGGRVWDGVREAEVMAAQLRILAPDAEVWLEPRSHSTVENALFSAELLRARGIDGVMLATCRWHLPRALAAFRRTGLVVAAPPSTWLEGPAATPLTWIKERIAAVRDARLLATREGMG
ncbi:MAG: YdcF family protein [Deltaproteobacteria bacterium]|nr:YdcF family protein [Deltaproteobacteria bacterium]